MPRFGTSCSCGFSNLLRLMAEIVMSKEIVKCQDFNKCDDWVVVCREEKGGVVNGVLTDVIVSVIE